MRVIRHVRQRTQAALAAGPRRQLLAFVADNAESGGHELVAIPDDAWRAGWQVAGAAAAWRSRQAVWGSMHRQGFDSADRHPAPVGVPPAS